MFEALQSERVAIVHRTRRRIRFKIVDLFGAPEMVAPLQTAMAALPGVQGVSATHLTGGLLLFIEPGCRVETLQRTLLEVLINQFGMAQGEPAEQDVSAAGAAHHPMLPAMQHRRRDLRLRTVPATVAVRGDGRAWWTIDCNQTLARVDSDAQTGLSVTAAAERLLRDGPNKLASAERRSDFAIFVGQFNSVPVAMLGASALVSVATGGLADATVILGVVLINAAIGFVTERQAERTIDALGKQVPRHAQIRRGGCLQPVPVEEVVVGDVILLSPGDYVPADMRLLRCDQLVVDESPLTGESLPVHKTSAVLTAPDTPLAERRNMAYMGTMVTGGSGIGVAVATAASTELGTIQGLVGATRPPETPLQRQLDGLGTQLGLLSGAVCAGVFFIGLWRGYGWLEMLKVSVSLAVAAVPEGLPAVATTTLALGIQNMRKQQVAVRHVDAVESLGAVQVFCFDKTGTLTQNRMTVLALHLSMRHFTLQDNQLLEQGQAARLAMEGGELWQLLRAVSLCTEAELPTEDGAHLLNGSPTENALVDLALRLGVDVQAVVAAHPRVDVHYRSEGHPYMYTVHAMDRGVRLVVVKGSPAEVLAMCQDVCIESRQVPLDDAGRAAVIAENDCMAGDALRVLGVAYGIVEAGCEVKLTDLTWVGLVGMADPLRAGMRDLMRQFHQAGIETVMITGDQSATAYAIGKQLGLSNGKPLQILDSTGLDKLDPQLLAGLVRRTHVFSRVSPAHKLQIVQAIQQAGYVVAMTGDGINDGPALKAADIGVAMGGAGTDVARSVADVVLEDDNLTTMTRAIAQGRTIYSNIRKAVHFLLSTNFSEIEVMLAGVATGLGQPLNAMQLLWINLASDIFPGLALSLEPPEKDVLKRAPRDPNEPIVRPRDLVATGLESAMITLGTLAGYVYGLRRYGAGPEASTIAFNALTVAQLLHAYSCRSEETTLFMRARGERNVYLDAAVAGTLGLQLAVGLIPGMRRLLGTAPLGIADFAVAGAAAAGPLLANQAIKSLRLTAMQGGAPQGASLRKME